MTSMKEAIDNATENNTQQQQFGVNIPLHKFPFGIPNPGTPLGRKIKQVDAAEKFIQQLFNNLQVVKINISGIKLGSAAGSMDRWALKILEKYADKAYAFIEPIMVPENVGFEMIPFYFRYEPVLKSLTMKMGFVDIAKSFEVNGVEFDKDNLTSPEAFNSIMELYFENTPIIIVEYGQLLPLYEYTDRAWRLTAIKEDPATMEVLKPYFDECSYEPREDRYYFIRRGVKDGETKFWLEKDARFVPQNQK